MAISLDQLHAPMYSAYSASELRLLYQLYEEAQRSRIAHGERLRAIIQGRSSPGSMTLVGDPDDLLKAISGGGTAGAPRILELAYSRAVETEAASAAALRESVGQHPVWPWLANVKGIGHLLAARLLSRLDVTRAKTPSAFWAYCGLGTIPGVTYRCSQCKMEVAYPLGYRIEQRHRGRWGGGGGGGAGECRGVLEPVDEQSTRVAPRRSTTGGRSGYDAQARVSCYLIGASMLRRGSEYRSYYDAERTRLAAAHPAWTPKRCHLSALRKMEKAFLRDLWLAWRRAVNLPVVAPYFPRIE
jgi:hypothetical protein